MNGWILAAAVLAASPATAQPPACAPTAEVDAELSRQFQERRVAAGRMAPGGILVIYATPDGRTWAAIREMPDGLSCYLTSGASWRVIITGRGA